MLFRLCMFFLLTTVSLWGKSIFVIGTDIIGLTTATCLARAGHQVTLYDFDPEKIASLKRGLFFLSEPGLKELFELQVKEKKLSFSAEISAINEVEFCFIANSLKKQEMEKIGAFIEVPLIFVTQSITHLGYTKSLSKCIKETVKMRDKTIPFEVIACPEFLRDGFAIYDFLKQERMLIGSINMEAAEKLKNLLEPIISAGQISIVQTRVAEFAKYASQISLRSPFLRQRNLNFFL